VADAGAAVPLTSLTRRITAQPFVPEDEHRLAARAEEILAIQSTGLARRLRAVRSAKMVIGLSGGLDSTLALLVCLEAAARLGETPAAVHAVTMPGPATSSHTLASARTLAETAGVDLREVDIRAAVVQHFADIGHDASVHDVTYENTQARERTQLLFDIANQQGGIVVGTGDLSELALGWCTFNGDHMASYNVHASVPKTLIAYLVRWYARHRASPALAAVLQRVLDTPISPELVPGRDDVIAQKTEDLVGPYRLHDFFLFHLLRHGSGPAKIDALAAIAFAGEYDRATIRRWLRVFCTRFFSQQFKRTTLPPGPKVGSVSLSPRGDWRMPDEASSAAWLAELDRLA
jgi:NAD+ synthase (glutamine-hydrolysing)